MSLDSIDRVAVLGAGNMGHGITEVTAMAGYDVTMRDIKDEFVDDGYESIAWSLEKLEEKELIDESADDVLSRIDTTTDLETAVSDADLVIEAAPENLDLKHDIFTDLEEFCDEDTLLATNTSSLPISDIAEVVDTSERVLGLHFFNPPVKMDLVEVIYGNDTSDEAAEAGYEWVESIAKTPIYVRKDVRGFVVNTIVGPFGGEPAFMVSEGEADIRQADATMSHERGYPMGPFELADLTGIDVGYHVRKEGDSPIPPITEEKVEAEELGQKTGKGFYDYEDGDGADYQPDDAGGFDWLRVEARMINRAAFLVGEDVAKPEEVDTGVQLGLGFPEGICRRADKIGLDEVLEKLETLHEETGSERFEPHPYLEELVEDGKTGEDAGEGFYEYDNEDGGFDSYHNINVELADGVLAVELDRPSRMNALSEDLLSEIDDLFSSVDTDEVRCATIEGAGDRAFSAGADVSGFSSANPTDLMDVSQAFETVNEFPRPVLAKIDGFCLGGGLELALACDLRVATDRSEFGAPEINLGLIPGAGGTQRLTRILGETRAKELVFRGNHIDADRAEEWGLINRAVDREAFDDTVEEFVSDLAGGPPIALKIAKQVMNEGQDASIDAALAMESQGFGLLTSTEDVLEGTMAFAEDREPEFEGK
ncbi:3-hydroxyacyl-CoA dehydrogenase/enoyl-CoA hydratase family protein [Natronorubrum daqingense]|uniref:3-hydroxyacyl-CoA dehydrogenase /Enoyl-CoA hydratase n=1 Tax=Natronorubrum daqingense TaxID=588898 RepID=A0A1N7C6V0_9EURY|nr:3-hydroxyacyl-CoA dehydrogenase NAD-binding domain-containing protein [Natronorubrum daqingense]APX96768.1 3-hydroxybutyryl-CoA dehydrogenase [Natronorubrum daqingense]SIR59329.1 3-hydroxyacyl-CoA dehydrogenase /Enoyl-CoA hydratase [Natronorubrum daqingense]